MSVIIEGIDLPKEDDVYFLGITPKGEVGLKTGLNEYVILEEAQAIQIPKGHGRLIDGGELNKSVHTWNPAYTYGRSAFTRAIDNAPTILEAEGEEDE